MTTNLKHDVAIEASKSSPAVAAVTAIKLFGIPLNDLVLLATFIYIVLQIAWLVYRWVTTARNASNNRRWND